MTEISKLIAYVLRHKPEHLGLEMDAHGWVSVEALIEKINQMQPFDMAQLEEIVRTDNKQRYSFSKDQTRIRANQGHSIPVDLELEPVYPPDLLWHGTGEKYVKSIDEHGLLPKSRQHVHLSADPETALNVGKRHGKPVLYIVNAAQMALDGLDFYCSENGVWLTNAVPEEYLAKTATVPSEWFNAVRETCQKWQASIVVLDHALQGAHAVAHMWWRGGPPNGESLFLVAKISEDDSIFSDGTAFYYANIVNAWEWDSSLDKIKWIKYDRIEELLIHHAYRHGCWVPLEHMPQILLSLLEQKRPTMDYTWYVYTSDDAYSGEVLLSAHYSEKNHMPHEIDDLKLCYRNSRDAKESSAVVPLISGFKSEILSWLRQPENQQKAVETARLLLKNNGVLTQSQQ